MFMTLDDVRKASRSRLIQKIAQQNANDVSADEVIEIADTVCPHSTGMLKSFLWNHDDMRNQRNIAVYIEDYIGPQTDERLLVLTALSRYLFRVLRNITNSPDVVLLNCGCNTIHVHGIVPRKIASCVQTSPESSTH